MRNIKKFLVILLLVTLSLGSFSANLADTEKAKSGKEFMDIFIINTEYETRYQNWMNEIKKLSPDEKTKNDIEAKKLIENKSSGEIFYKSQDGVTLMSSKIDKGLITSMSMYDKDGVIVKISEGEIVVYYRSGKKAMITKSSDIDPRAGRFKMNPENGIGELYYENGKKAGETTPDDHVIFYHENGKPFIERKKGWDKEKIY